MRVSLVTPAGRKRYLEILLPYVLQEQGWIDEYQLWVNTTQEEDIEYIEEVARRHRKFVRLVWPVCPPLGRRTVGQFYATCTDRGTLYIKLDDDICFISKGALRSLARFRVENPDYFLVLPNVVNSVRTTYMHQQIGAMGVQAGIATSSPFCPVSWKSGRFAAQIHMTFLSALQDASISNFQFAPWPLEIGERSSLNCCAWLGRDFAEFGGRVDGDDEQFLSVDKPRELGRPNCILGDAVMVHFAYEPQRPYLERTGLLSRYRKVAERIQDALFRASSPRL